MSLVSDAGKPVDAARAVGEPRHDVP